MSEIEISQNALTANAEIVSRELHDGIQVMIRFANGYGLSVVRHSMSYGSHAGLWEAAPVRYIGLGMYDWEFCGRTNHVPGYESDDVKGWLYPSQVDEIATLVATL